MQVKNFTTSQIWQQSNRIRYDIKNIVNLDGVDFLIKENEIQCLQFFNIDFTDNLLKLLKSASVNEKDIVFKYINLAESDKTFLKNWCEKNNLEFQIVDEWNAPMLFLDTAIEEHISKGSTQLKRDFVKYLQDDKMDYELYDKTNLKLWTDVLYIDRNSWKGEKNCDMKSLEREDLQYVFYLMNNLENSSLMVASKDGEPLAYSLWFKSEDDQLWYAAKWGASTNGRAHSAGIKVLFNHIFYMKEQTENLKLDFWGRRSNFYDMIKNKDIKRYHFKIRRKNG